MSMHRKWRTSVYKEKQLCKIWGIPVIKQMKKLVKSGNLLIEMSNINIWYIYHKYYALFKEV